MAPVSRSNRARKPRDYWDPTISPPHQRQLPAFTIYTEPTEPTEFIKDLDTQLPEDLSKDECLSEDLSEDEGLSEGLSEDQSEDEGLSEDEDLSEDEGLSEDKGLSEDEILSEHLSTQLHEYLSQPPKHPSYQPQFPPKDRAGKPQKH